MNVQKLCGLFKPHRIASQNLQKNLVAHGHLRITRGRNVLRKARKYRRPQDLEDPYYHGMGPKKEVTSAFQSVAARGFAKEQPSYEPAKDVDVQLHNICLKIFGAHISKEWEKQDLSNTLLKFKVLTKCAEVFKKDVPNSNLHKIKNLADLLEFYRTPVDGCLHYDALVRDSDKLPPNLHVMAETPTFNPSADTFFDGKTAYPGRKRIIHTKTGEKFEKIVEWPHL